MARFMFVVPPLTGHTNPTVSVALELQERGHDVCWVGHPGKVRPLLPEGATLHALDDRVPEAILQERVDKARRVRGLAGLKFMWEDFFLPLARAMRDGVEAAARDWKPDVIVSDQQALAGGLVARRLGLPWVTSCTTSAGVTDPLGGLPKVKEWVTTQLDELQVEAGLEPVAEADLSPYGVVVFSTRALVGPGEFGSNIHFVGPSFRHRSDQTAFPFDRLTGDEPKVLVSLGTVNADRGARFYRTAVDALAADDLTLVLAAPPEMVGPVPDNVIVQSWVPQLRLLPLLDGLVTHGGHNTVCEALAHGLPMVVAPIKDDQPVVAAQVEDAGAGLRIRFGRVRAEGLQVAVRSILEDPAYRQGAERIAESFRQAGGAAAAADLMEGLV